MQYDKIQCNKYIGILGKRLGISQHVQQLPTHSVAFISYLPHSFAVTRLDSVALPQPLSII